MEDVEEIALLLFKNSKGSLSDEERARLEQWKSDPKNLEFFKELPLPEDLYGQVINNEKDRKDDQDAFPAYIKEIKGRLLMIRFKRGMAVAAIILALAMIPIIINMLAKPGNITARENKGVESLDMVKPAVNKAQLLLHDGRVIDLDSFHTGEIARQGENTLIQGKIGTIAYQVAGKATGQEMFNRLSTPKGGVFQVTLSDSSVVWLNAGSSLYYPVAFNEKRRIVYLKGEAYFEVHKSKAPFIVEIEQQGSATQTQIIVTGTHFNVKAYPEDAVIQATLLEGAIHLKHGDSEKTIKPGQQGFVESADNKDVKVKSKVSMKNIMAWKNGYFEFEDAHLKEILDEVSRWYNVKIEVSGRLPDELFTGSVTRSTSLDEVLKLFEGSGLNFSMHEGVMHVDPHKLLE